MNYPSTSHSSCTITNEVVDWGILEQKICLLVFGILESSRYANCLVSLITTYVEKSIPFSFPPLQKSPRLRFLLKFMKADWLSVAFPDSFFMCQLNVLYIRWSIHQIESNWNCKHCFQPNSLFIGLHAVPLKLFIPSVFIYILKLLYCSTVWFFLHHML